MRKKGCRCKRLGCRPGRPLCREQRAKSPVYKVCYCDGFHYPHRRTSGACKFAKDAEKKQWENFTGMKWTEVA